MGLSTGYLGKSNYVMNESVGADTRRQGPHKIAEIRDGTSNVMHVAEKDEVERVAATWVALVRSTSSVGFRVVNPLNSTNRDPGSGNPTYSDRTQPCARYRVGSMHPGGANILFCDGSVHFISETIPAAQGNDCGNSYAISVVHKYDPINPEQWQKLFGRKDGQPIGPL